MMDVFMRSSARLGFLGLVAFFVPGLSGVESEVGAAMVTVPIAAKTSFSFGFGFLKATGEEIVYGGASADGELSRLIWETEEALTVEAGIHRSLGSRLEVYADFTTTIVDQGRMTNYDWLGSSPRWTDRSIHDDTSLDAYYRVDAGLAWTLLDRHGLVLSALGGFRYIDISWTAHGGSYIYSSDPNAGLFRDDRGSFPAGEKGISYRQKIPGFYIGPQAEWTSGPLALQAALVGGLTVGVTDRDRHWQRNLLFDEEFDSQGFFEFSVGLRYALTRSLTFYLDGLYDHYEPMKGAMQVTDLSSGEINSYSGDAAGARFGSWQVRAGIEFQF